MIIQIDKIKEKDKLSLDFTDTFVMSKDFDLESHDVVATFKGTILKEPEYLKLEGVLSFDIFMSCSRCLTSVKESFNIDVLEFYKNNDSHYEDVDGDDNYIYFDTLELDLNPSLLINIQLHTPSTVLCDEDCKGLCQYCGINLNHETCSCEPPIDPRWESLKSLLNE